MQGVKQKLHLQRRLNPVGYSPFNRKETAQRYRIALRQLLEYPYNLDLREEVIRYGSALAYGHERILGDLDKVRQKIRSSQKARNPSPASLAKCRKALEAAEKEDRDYISKIPISAGFDWERNPNKQKFIIIDKRGKSYGETSTDYDKLQNIVDRKNESSDSQNHLFVVSVEDYTAMQGKGRQNPYHIAPDKSDIYAVYIDERFPNKTRIIRMQDLSGKDKDNLRTGQTKIIFRGLHDDAMRFHISKRNHTASDFRTFQKDRLNELGEMFQGEASGINHRLLEPDSAPRDKQRLGHLVLMKVKHKGRLIPINFDGDAVLCMDLRKNLWAVGKDSIIEKVLRPKKGDLKFLGKLHQIDYVTAKKHIEGGKTVRFWHKLGEVDRQYPDLYIDHDGFPIIIGGGYDVWDVGIVN